MPSKNLDATPIYYRPGLWGSRESFVYSYKAALLAATLKIDFSKIDDITGFMHAQASVRVPLGRPIQFRCETKFKNLEGQESTNRFEFYREQDLQKGAERTISFDGDKYCFTGEIRGREGDLAALRERAPAIVNPLLIFLGLRTYMNQENRATHSMLVATSGRLVPLEVRPGSSPNDVELEARVVNQSQSSARLKDTRTLRIEWDEELGAPKKVSFDVPLFGAIDLRLESSDASK